MKNAEIVAKSAVEVQFRMPLIPGINDDLYNIKATAQFLRKICGEGNASIELMVYHRLGLGKYRALDRDYPLGKACTFDLEFIRGVVKLVQQTFEKEGVNCLVSV